MGLKALRTYGDFNDVGLALRAGGAERGLPPPGCPADSQRNVVEINASRLRIYVVFG